MPGTALFRPIGPGAPWRLGERDTEWVNLDEQITRRLYRHRVAAGLHAEHRRLSLYALVFSNWSVTGRSCSVPCEGASPQEF